MCTLIMRSRRGTNGMQATSVKICEVKKPKMSYYNDDLSSLFSQLDKTSVMKSSEESEPKSKRKSINPNTLMMVFCAMVTVVALTALGLSIYNTIETKDRDGIARAFKDDQFQIQNMKVTNEGVFIDQAIEAAALNDTNASILDVKGAIKMNQSATTHDIVESVDNDGTMAWRTISHIAITAVSGDGSQLSHSADLTKIVMKTQAYKTGSRFSYDTASGLLTITKGRRVRLQAFCAVTGTASNAMRIGWRTQEGVSDHIWFCHVPYGCVFN